MICVCLIPTNHLNRSGKRELSDCESLNTLEAQEKNTNHESCLPLSKLFQLIMRLTVLLIAFLALSALSIGCSPEVSPETGLFLSNLTESSTQDGSECHPFGTLSLALAAAQSSSNPTTLMLASDVESEEALEGIKKEVICRGRGNRITLGETFRIEKSGKLVVIGAKVLGKRGIDVVGSLEVEECEVQIEEHGIVVYGGAVTIVDSWVGHSKDGFIRIEGHGVRTVMRNVTFAGHTQTLLSLGSAAAGEIAVEALESLFERNTATALFQLSAFSANLSLSLRITDCRFVCNTGEVFSSFVTSLTTAIRNCSFLEGNSGLLLHGTAANVTISNIVWTGNSGLFLQSALQQVLISVSNISIRNQRKAGFVALSGLKEASSCLLFLDEVDYRDSTYFNTDRSAGLLLLQTCSCFLTNAYIANVSIEGHFGQYNGFIDIQQSYLQVNSLQMANCTTNQVFFYLILSSTFISNLKMQHIKAGLNSLIIGTLSPSLIFSNVRISSAVATSTSDMVGITTKELMYFTMQLVNITIADIVLDSAECKCVLCSFFGASHVSNLQLHSMAVKTGVIAIAGHENASSNFTIINSAVNGVWGGGVYCSIRANGLTLHSSTLFFVFGCGTYSLCSAANLAVSSVTAEVLLLGGHTCRISVQTLSVTHSTFKFAFKVAPQTSISVRNSSFEDSELGLLRLYKCSFFLSDSHLLNLRSRETFLVGTQSDVAFDRVTATNVSVGQWGRFTENSTLSLTYFKAARLEGTVGIKLAQSSVSLANSQIEQFPFTFLEVNNGNVTLTWSKFFYGGSTDRQISQRGALLSCSHCPLIYVHSVTASHLLSPEGGAISALYSLVFITNSWLEHCVAMKGGALQLTQTPYTLQSSNFTNCWANITGGALDTVNSDLHSTIRHCQFVRNTALQGGAVNFHQQVGELVDSFFEKNSADYGPDLASYGIKARIAPSFPLADVFLSGNSLPSALDIEVLDHYGQVVHVDSVSELRFLATNAISYAGASSLLCERGTFHLYNNGFYAPPGTSQVALFIVNFPKAESVTLRVPLSFRPCESGEIHQANSCIVCLSGTYSFFPNDTSCALCPRHAFCKGKNIVEVDSGHWRSSNNSATVYTCPHASACEGGQQSTCSGAYTGKLCTGCAEDYYRVGTLYCEKCSKWMAVCQVILFIVQYLGVLYWAERCVKRDGKGFVEMWLWLEHSQYLMVLLRLKTELPSLFYYAIRPFHFLGSLSVSSIPLSCLFPASDVVYEKVYISVAMPLLLLLPKLVTALISFEAASWKAFVRRWLLLSLLCGAALIEAGSDLLISFSLGDSKRWLYNDASIEAWSSAHSNYLLYVFVPSIILCVILPLPILFLAIRKNCSIVAFLIDRWQPMWTFVGICGHIWKLIFIFTVILVSDLPHLFQIAVALALLIPAVVVLVACRPPVQTGNLFYLAVCSRMVVYASFSAAGYYAGSSSDEVISGFCFGFAFILGNLCFFAVYAYTIHQDTRQILNIARPSDSAQGEMCSLDLFVPPNSLVLSQN